MSTQGLLLPAIIMHVPFMITGTLVHYILTSLGCSIVIASLVGSTIRPLGTI